MLSGAVGVVVLRNPFSAVLALVGHLLSLAVLFLLLRAEFVAAIQVVVYAGAVMVLYLFVVAYVGDRADSASGAAAPARSARACARPGVRGRTDRELLIARLELGRRSSARAPRRPATASARRPRRQLC